jgi:competence protein ComEC
MVVLALLLGMGEVALSKSKIFLICCIAFITGVAIASFLPVKFIQNDLRWFIGMTASIVLLVLFWKNKIVRIAALAGLFLFLGLWRYSVGLPENTPDKIWHYNGQTVTVIGKIVNEPDVRRNNVKYVVEAKKLSFQEGSLASVGGKILITVDLYPRYNYGDELEIACKLQKPEPFSGFSYDRYLARYDIYSVCYYPKITFLAPSPYQGEGWGEVFYKKIFSLKDKFREIINYGLSEPESSLARAIILGDKKVIPDDLRDKFSQTGVSHIAAISGMHISVLAGLVMVMLLAAGLWRRHAFYFASAFLTVYIILIGAPASAMRAGLMGFLVLWALNIGRLNKLTNSLVLAAALLLFINPKLLRDDVGFQLSFLAVLGIVFAYPLLSVILNGAERSEESRGLNNGLIKEKIFCKLRSFASLRMTKKLKPIFSILNITITAQIFTLPIIALNFSQVSIVAPIANLLIIWTLPFLIIAILIALFLSLMFPNISFLFFLPAKLLLKYIIIIVEFLAKLPFAYFNIDYLWWGWAVLYYGAVGWIVYAAKRGFVSRGLTPTNRS